MKKCAAAEVRGETDGWMDTTNPNSIRSMVNSSLPFLWLANEISEISSEKKELIKIEIWKNGSWLQFNWLLV